MTVFLLGTEWPQLVGPYASYESCVYAEEVYVIRGFETHGCSLIQISLEPRHGDS